MQVSDPLQSALVTALRAAGARFAWVHGSRAVGCARPDSDVDVAAHFGGRAPDAWRIEVPAGVDLVVLDDAPLEIAGRVALRGELLFDDDPSARVTWQARTRLVYLDEELLQRQLDRAFTEARGGR